MAAWGGLPVADPPPARNAMTKRPRSTPPRLLLALLLFAFASLATASNTRVATDANGNPLPVDGSVVIIEPDIELSEGLAGGVEEPRREWSQRARRLYPEEVHKRLQAGNVQALPDYDIPDDLPPETRLGQVLRLNEAVSMSVLAYTQPGNQLATKHGKKLDWTLGPGVEELRKVTHADYALFTYVRDSYTSGGRKALRIASLLLLGGDIGGGQQVGVTTLVDLRTGQVVWFNYLARQTGDLRDEQGARATVQDMLKGLPL
jgi:hypothetical protein